MKCSYHPTMESQDFCNVCSKPLCAQCAHQIKSKVYCQDCLVQGAEWAATVKGLRMPSDSPKRAAICSIIPGMGAVYNSEYLKAITFFAVFAALVMMADSIHGVFGFGAFAFVLFTMFDSHRTAEQRARAKLEMASQPSAPEKDKSIMAWGLFLIVLGVLFLLQNLIPYRFLQHLWPLMFIFLGAYLVYRSLKDREQETPSSESLFSEKKEF